MFGIISPSQVGGSLSAISYAHPWMLDTVYHWVNLEPTGLNEKVISGLRMGTCAGLEAVEPKTGLNCWVPMPAWEIDFQALTL